MSTSLRTARLKTDTPKLLIFSRQLPVMATSQRTFPTDKRSHTTRTIWVRNMSSKTTSRTPFTHSSKLLVLTRILQTHGTISVLPTKTEVSTILPPTAITVPYMQTHATIQPSAIWHCSTGNQVFRIRPITLKSELNAIERKTPMPTTFVRRPRSGKDKPTRPDNTCSALSKGSRMNLSSMHF